MATTATPSVVPWNPLPNQDMLVVTWALADGETGDLVEYAELADRSIQFEGIFGGSTIVFAGSNDGVNWHTLTAPDGTSISATQATLFQISEATRYVRPASTGGAGSSIVATMFCRRQRRIY